MNQTNWDENWTGENWGSSWTPWMWSAIADAEDGDKVQLIAHFKKKEHLWKDRMCVTCGLEPKALNLDEKEIQ